MGNNDYLSNPSPRLQADLNRFKELRETGRSNAEIAAELGRSERTLHGWASHLGNQRWTHHRFTEDEISDAIQRYEAGEALQTIADSIGCSRQTIMRRLRDAGIEIIRTTDRAHPANGIATERTASGTSCVTWRLKNGYVLVRVANDHPLFLYTNGGWVEEHRLRMMEKLGRPLAEGENVHHKNGVRDDNRLRNLELWSTSQPPGASVQHKIRWAIEFLQQYGYTITKG
jgi:hypothetical protein